MMVDRIWVLVGICIGLAFGIFAGMAGHEDREVKRITIDGVETSRCTEWYHPDRIDIDCHTEAPGFFGMGTDSRNESAP